MGKTTLAGHLAVVAASGGKTVVMFDEDPQHSLTEWFDSRQIEHPLLADLANLAGIRASTKLIWQLLTRRHRMTLASCCCLPTWW